MASSTFPESNLLLLFCKHMTAIVRQSLSKFTVVVFFITLKHIKKNLLYSHVIRGIF